MSTCVPSRSPTSVNFDDPQALRALCSPPPDPAAEPEASFPLGWYEEFLQEIARLRIEVITYRDLFHGSDDWDYRSNYKREFYDWSRNLRDRRKRYLLIQHDVDNHPHFTKRVVAMEQLYGVRSNIFLFCQRWSKSGGGAPYEVDHDFFRRAEQRGFVVGYHQNAFALTGFDMAAAVERFRQDVRELRQLYNIEFVVPHGGAGLVKGGETICNVDVPLPPELEGNLRWVYNRYGVRFESRWSDGGLRKTRDPKRIRNLDIIRRFLHTLKPGTRNFCLVHPQRWGFNVDERLNPMLAEQPWYREVCARYATWKTA